MYTGSPSVGQLPTAKLQIVDGNPPLDKTPPSCDQVRLALAVLWGAEAADVCSINTELLKSGGIAIIL